MIRKFALIIGNNEYQDPKLAQLSSPSQDVEGFSQVLKDPNVGAFDVVDVLLNQSSSIVSEAIDNFFDEKKANDLLLMYFSGHGVLDDRGVLYLAMTNTNTNRLRSTAISSEFINGVMDNCRSKRQVLILDCNNSGAFARAK